MHTTRRICAAVLLGSISAAGLAAEVQVLSAGAVQPGLIASAAAFREEAGHDIKVTYAIASELRKRVGGGEMADILIAPPGVTGDLVKSGKVSAEGQVAIGRVGARVVARNGAPLPDISSAEGLSARCSTPIPWSTTALRAGYTSTAC